MKLKEFINYVEQTEMIRIRVYKNDLIESVTSPYMVKNFFNSDAYKALSGLEVLKGCLYNVPCLAGDPVLNISVRREANESKRKSNSKTD